MEYLLVMSLSGSVMTCLYLLLRCLLKQRVSARLYYLLAKAAVLYYLIPLPFLKGWYKTALHRIMPERQTEIVQVSLRRTIYVIRSGEKMYVNAYTVIQVAVAAVWLFTVCFLMAGMLIDYVRTSRVIGRCADKSMTDRQQAFLDEIKARYGVKQPVVLSCGYAGAHTMTFGVRRPVIICDRESGSREAQLLVCHEMVHIRRRDVLWKMLMQFAAILHWWNPVTRMLQHDFERVCECSCDETVMQGKTREEVREYQALLAAEALTQRKTEQTALRWEAGFGNDQNTIQERVTNLNKRKKWNRSAAALAAVLMFANSITVFAYRDMFREFAPMSVSSEEIEQSLDHDTYLFVPDGASEEEIEHFELLENPEIQYDKQFTDEEGVIYQIPKKASEAIFRGGYRHTYVSGTAVKHKKNPDGSCEGIEYRTQRCSECGSVIWGEQISSHQYVVCPH